MDPLVSGRLVLQAVLLGGERETMVRQKTANALEATRLVRRAADGDGQAWERLIGHYRELVVAIHGDQMASDEETLQEAPGPGPKIDGPLRATKRTQPVGDVLLSLPLRWQQLLQLLLADPAGQHPRQQVQ